MSGERKSQAQTVWIGRDQPLLRGRNGTEGVRCKSAALAWERKLPPEEVIFGSSPAMLDIRRKIEKAASVDIPVLLQGETGTGKEVLARFVHCSSQWGDGPFIKVNCPAVPAALFESELFGYEKGAFTGAYESKLGRVELARGGTLLLDEMGELDLNVQAKLLQLLQDGEFCRLGGKNERVVQARIVCATNKRLQQAVKQGTFRQDLFYRISVFAVELPALQQRNGDIPMLVAYFLEKYGRKYGCSVPPVSNSLLSRMQKHSWPGNIRELENVIHHYVLFESEEAISSDLDRRNCEDLVVDWPSSKSIALKEITQGSAKEIERRIILETLEANGWHRGVTARALGISYPTLLYKMKNAGLPMKRCRRLGVSVVEGLNLAETDRTEG